MSTHSGDNNSSVKKKNHSYGTQKGHGSRPGTDLPATNSRNKTDDETDSDDECVGKMSQKVHVTQQLQVKAGLTVNRSRQKNADGRKHLTVTVTVQS